MRPSSFVTLFVLITTIFAAPLNLTIGIDGESDISILLQDPSMPPQRRDGSQTDEESVYSVVQGLKADHATIQDNIAYNLKKKFRGSWATLKKMTARSPLEQHTIEMMLSNLITIGQLIKFASVDSPKSSEGYTQWTEYYVVTKFMGVPARELKNHRISEPLSNLREKARREYQEKFQLIFPSDDDDDDDDDDYVYRSRFTQGNKELEAKIVGVNWAFAKPVHHPDPGEPEIFV